MKITDLYNEINRLIAESEKREAMFKQYIKSNGLEDDYEKFCKEYQRSEKEKKLKQEKHPLKEQIPKR